NVVNVSGKETGAKVQLSDSVFGIEPNDHAIYLDVKQYLANQRQGTHKAKQRNEIAGSTRKLYKQKGTGGARAGNIKSALSYKAKDSSIVVVEDFTFDTIKTKSYIQLQNDLKVSDVKTLLVLGAANNNVYLSGRNLKGTKVIVADQLNTYDVLNAGKLILTTGALKTLEEALAK